MECKKCGCDTFSKEGDWYICANCGAQFFDTDIQVNDIQNPTLEVEKLQQKQNTHETPKEEPTKKSKKKKSKKDKPEEKPGFLHELVDFCTPIVIAVVVAIVLKIFVFANAVVPSGSMLNTIQLNDRIIASKLSYINNDPERYDIVIFISPNYNPDEPEGPNNEKYYVKRIIGLPGETIEIVNGIVYATTPDGSVYQLDDSFVTNCEPVGDFGPFQVPEGCYFMMGDNRNDSYDSRYWNQKYIAKEDIIGKVKFKYFPGFSTFE